MPKQGSLTVGSSVSAKEIVQALRDGRVVKTTSTTSPLMKQVKSELGEDLLYDQRQQYCHVTLPSAVAQQGRQRLE